MTCSASDVFADWLDVTYSPEAFPIHDLGLFLQSVHASRGVDGGNGRQFWRMGDGMVTMDDRPRWGRVSASGAALAYLRTVGAFESYLATLAEEAHTVTRLDVAMDVARDGADVVAELRGQYPLQCALSRKTQRVKSILEPRESDGRETGTWYVGHRAKGEVTARVYDKAQEVLVKQGRVMGPTTRYEVTVKKGYGPTLRDAARPAALFWHFAAPSLLPRPEGVPEWEAGWGVGWSWQAPEVLPAAVLCRRVEGSPEVGALIALADAVGISGREMLLSLLAKRVRAA